MDQPTTTGTPIRRDPRKVYVDVRDVAGRVTQYGPFANSEEADRLARQFTANHKFSTSEVATTSTGPKSAARFRLAAASRG